MVGRSGTAAKRRWAKGSLARSSSAYAKTPKTRIRPATATAATSKAPTVNLDAGAEPTIIRETPTSGDVCVRRRLVSMPRLEIPDGFPAPRFVLAGAFEGRAIETIAFLENPVWLPVGEYDLQPLFRFVKEAYEIPPKLVVKRGGDEEIVLQRKGELVPCDLSFSAPHGMRVPPIRELGLAQPGGPTQFWRSWDPRDADYLLSLSPRQWLAPGIIEVHATTEQMGRTSHVFDVRGGDGVVALRIALQR